MWPSRELQRRSDVQRGFVQGLDCSYMRLNSNEEHLSSFQPILNRTIAPHRDADERPFKWHDKPHARTVTLNLALPSPMSYLSRNFQKTT